VGTLDPRVDAYIADAADFARPILTRLRTVVHATCPSVEEAIKWRRPHFMYEGVLCGMAAFKQHCAFGFWRGRLVVGDDVAGETAMGQFGRIASVAELPPDDVLAGYIRTAMRLNESAAQSPTRARPRTAREIELPSALAAALAEHPAASAAFERMSPSHRQEYAEWVAEAKGDATRARRVATAVEWIAEGKARNWKYERR
jgi:uncharacterized protein YdeI (YjbR/CyaY-like superfamily)